MSTPYFSIVIPTRNRAILLRDAVLSALSQGGEDYEIVVSDNSTNDDSQKVIADISHPRLRYVRPPESLMRMADSWEFALSQARGQLVTFLCDDDALSPLLLTRLRELISARGPIDIVTWGSASYNHANWTEPEKRNVLYLPSYTYTCQERDSHDALQHVFDQIWPSRPVPKMLQAACSKQIIARVRSKVGRFFIPSAPDLSTAVFTLALTKTYLYIDEPLMLSGAALESTGAGQWNDGGEKLRKFRDAHGGENFFSKLPLQGFLGINVCAQTLMDAKLAMPEELSHYELNWSRYFTDYRTGLLLFAAQGVDMNCELANFERVLAEQPKDLRDSVHIIAAQQKTSPLRQWVQHLVYNSLILRYIKSLLRPDMKSIHQAEIRGENAGFCNIHECAQRLPSLINAKR